MNRDRIINSVLERYLPEETVPQTLEECLTSKLEGLSEGHVFLLLSLFESLNEVNQHIMLETVETVEGVNSLIDFALENRGK